MEERDDYDVLKEQMYRKAFGTEHNEELKEKLDSGVAEFAIEHYETMKNGDEMAYRIQFSRGGENNNAYMDGFSACLIKDLDAPGQVKEHFFEARHLITAHEAHRLLKYGSMVAVNKNLINKEKEKYNVWISINTNGTKDENGNYPEMTFHQNYFGDSPFSPREVLPLLNTPVLQVQNSVMLEEIDKKLRKANIAAVNYTDNGQQVKGHISINPERAEATLYNNEMRAIETVSVPRNPISMKYDRSKNISEGPDGADEKKKHGQQQGWGSKRYPGRGMKP